MDKIIYIKQAYKPSPPYLPVPILAHTDEIVLPVEICVELYPYLKNPTKTIPTILRRKLKDIFEKNQIRI
jgi:hypothetical protein